MGNLVIEGFELHEDEFGNLSELNGGQRVGDSYNDVVREEEFLEDLDYEL